MRQRWLRPVELLGAAFRDSFKAAALGLGQGQSPVFRRTTQDSAEMTVHPVVPHERWQKGRIQ